MTGCPFTQQEYKQKYASQEHFEKTFPVEYLAKYLETGHEPDIKAGYPAGYDITPLYFQYPTAGH